MADKTEPGAWNFFLYKIFADPFNTSGLVIDPSMHKGFVFEVHDLVEKRRIMFKCPEEIYNLLAYIGAPSRYVIKHVFKREGDIAASTSTQRLSLIAGRYVGKDDPVMIVRSQSGFPAVGEVIEPFCTPVLLPAGCVDHTMARLCLSDFAMPTVPGSMVRPGSSVWVSRYAMGN